MEVQNFQKISESFEAISILDGYNFTKSITYSGNLAGISFSITVNLSVTDFPQTFSKGIFKTFYIEIMPLVAFSPASFSISMINPYKINYDTQNKFIYSFDISKKINVIGLSEEEIVNAIQSLIQKEVILNDVEDFFKQEKNIFYFIFNNEEITEDDFFLFICNGNHYNKEIFKAFSKLFESARPKLFANPDIKLFLEI